MSVYMLIEKVAANNRAPTMPRRYLFPQACQTIRLCPKAETVGLLDDIETDLIDAA